MFFDKSIFFFFLSAFGIVGAEGEVDAQSRVFLHWDAVRELVLECAAHVQHHPVRHRDLPLLPIALPLYCPDCDKILKYCVNESYYCNSHGSFYTCQSCKSKGKNEMISYEYESKMKYGRICSWCKRFYCKQCANDDLGLVSVWIKNTVRAGDHYAVACSFYLNDQHK